MTKRLELLRFNHAGVMLLKNGSSANYGVIRNENGKLVYFTGKGLREMWSPNMNEEEKIRAIKLKKIFDEYEGEKQLIKTEHIAIISLDEIERVLF